MISDVTFPTIEILALKSSNFLTIAFTQLCLIYYFDKDVNNDN